MSSKNTERSIRLARAFGLLALISSAWSAQASQQPVIRAVTTENSVGHIPNPIRTQSAAKQEQVLGGTPEQLRAWLLQQEEVEKKIFEGQELAALEEDTDRFFDPDHDRPRAAPAVHGTRIASTQGTPVIRAVMAPPPQMAVGTAPAHGTATVCAWPKVCHGRPVARVARSSKQPSEKSRQYALSTRLNLAAFAAEVNAAARRFGVDPLFIRAIMHAESSFNPSARSHVGAQGLMQLMPATARRFGVTNAYVPGENVRGGAQYLAWLLRRFNGNVQLAAAAYNAGEGAVDRHGGIPPYRETVDYVEKVITLWSRYQQALNGGR
jgi:hypothetical protein